MFNVASWTVARLTWPTQQMSLMVKQTALLFYWWLTSAVKIKPSTKQKNWVLVNVNNNKTDLFCVTAKNCKNRSNERAIQNLDNIVAVVAAAQLRYWFYGRGGYSVSFSDLKRCALPPSAHRLYVCIGTFKDDNSCFGATSQPRAISEISVMINDIFVITVGFRKPNKWFLVTPTKQKQSNNDIFLTSLLNLKNISFYL